MPEINDWSDAITFLTTLSHGELNNLFLGLLTLAVAGLFFVVLGIVVRMAK